MRKLRWSLAIVAVAVQIAAAAVWLWTRNRRMGTKPMNETVNRFLLRCGLAGGRASAIATVHSAVPWDSSPDSGNINACGLLNDLKADLSPGGAADVLIGFSKNYSTNYQGCAEIGGDEALLMWHSDGPDPLESFAA